MLHRLLALFAMLALLTTSAHAVPDYLWREAETADTASFSMQATPGSPEFSGGQWLKEGIPDGGALSYKLNVQQPGDYHLWLRIGMEFIRASTQWRIDGGEWKTIGPNDLSTNLTGIWYWAEISWMNAGTVNLKAGTHELEVKFGPKTGDNMVAAFDCFCLVQGDWVPDGSLKPGEQRGGELDKQAAAQIFRFPNSAVSTPGERQSLSLSGLWQVARHDDLDMNKDRYEPVRDFPAEPRWRGINIPSDYASQVSALKLGHRVWFRTKVDIPADMSGRSFMLDFAGTNWIASVVVNGQFMGWRKSTRVPWQCDITKGIKPGQVNEIWIGIKDFYYSIENDSLNRSRNIPLDAIRQWPPHFVAPIMPSTKGDADGLSCGITDPVSLIVTGAPAYVSDVFVKTTVTDAQFKPTNKRISAEITLTNPTDRDATLSVSADALFAGSGKAEKSITPVSVTVPAGKTQMVSLNASWPEAKLWWPQQNPTNLYTLRTSVVMGGKVVDVHDQSFGFREVKIDGKYIRINGLRRNFWNLLGGLSGSTNAQRLSNFYLGNNRFERFSADISGQIPASHRREQLDWADKHGIPGRLSTMIDGMSITYTLENQTTWENFKEHIDQVVRNYRNHPSVIVYSLENELLFINGALTRDSKGMDLVEENAQKYLVETAHQLDPTRPVMFDGGGAFKNNTVDICCTHYAEDGFQPDNAYTLGKIISQSRWIWDMNRPYSAGEVAYFSGNNSDHAWIGGELASTGKVGAIKSYAKYLKYLFERYRWNDVAMICPWTAMAGAEECWNAMNEIAVFTREYNSSFFGGEKMTRTVKVFNDTFSTDPLSFTWKMLANGKLVGSGTQQLSIEPGFAKQLPISCVAPKVAGRVNGQLILEVIQKGANPFKDVKPVVFYPRVKGVKLSRSLYVIESKSVTSKMLASLGIIAKPVKGVAGIKPGGIVLVGSNAVAEKQAINDLMGYTQSGGRVVILEQDQPILGDRLGTPVSIGKGLDQKAYSAYFAFAQQGTKLLDGLNNLTLSNWTGFGSTSKTVWEKSSGAARSWITCGPALNGSTLIEMPKGKGEVIATQMRVGELLMVEPAAQLLLVNMLKRADTYSRPSATVGVYAPDSVEIGEFITGLGCQQKKVSKLSDGLDIKKTPVLVVHASKTGLEALNSAKAQLDAYTQAGGYVMMIGLQPDGLTAYNKLLGTQHVMREFRRESVQLISDPLMAGVSSSDLSQFTDQVIAPWSGQRNVSRDVFSYCLDGEDIAPFCFGAPNPDYPEMNGGGAYNLVNGLFNADMWWYIDQISYDPTIPENELVSFKLPVASKLKSITIWNNKNYDTVKECDIRLNGKSVKRVELPDSFDAVEVPLGGASASSLTLTSLRKRVHGTSKLVGLDEVKILRELPDWYKGKVYPLVSSGGMMRYPRGTGGFILNNLKLDAPTRKDFPENLAKKRRITSVLLQNLGVAFNSEDTAQQEGQKLGPNGLPIYIPPTGRANLGEKE